MKQIKTYRILIIVTMIAVTILFLDALTQSGIKEEVFSVKVLHKEEVVSGRRMTYVERMLIVEEVKSGYRFDVKVTPSEFFQVKVGDIRHYKLTRGEALGEDQRVWTLMLSMVLGLAVLYLLYELENCYEKVKKAENSLYFINRRRKLYDAEELTLNDII